MSLYEIFRRQPHQENSSVIQHWRRKKGEIKQRCKNRGRKWGYRDCQPILKVIHGWQTSSYCFPSHIRVYIQVQMRKATTLSASPFLRSPAMPQRGKAGWNVEEWDPATATSNENTQQMEMLSPLSFLRGLLQQGLAGVYTRAKRQWPRQPALPSCQRVSLSIWFPVALVAACTCSLKILRPLPRYLLIQKSLPPPQPLLPRPWGHSTSHHPAGKFSLHKDGTEGSSWMCIIREAKTLQLYIVPAPLSTPSASQEAV